MKTAIYCGIDNLSTVKNDLKGHRLGLITGPSGVDRSLRPTYEIIHESFRLTALFSAEHGLRGDVQAGGKTKNHRDSETGVMVYSLYGDTTFPTREMMDKIDIMLFDMQDVGARYYTYLYTLTRAMKTCAAAGKPLYLLDRINPISLGRLEGNILDPRFASFVGEYAIPVRYGMTIGEFARYINAVREIGCDLTIVPCEGLTRDLYFGDTDLSFIPPSPNIPTPETAINYIGTCLFEGTNVSEGRGTTRPFDLIGAPWMKSKSLCERMKGYGFDGVIIRRAFFIPTFSKYAGEQCEGVQLHITDRDRYQPFEVAVRLIDEIRAEFSEFEMLPGIDRLFGDDKLRLEYTERRAIDTFLSVNEHKIAKFKQESRQYYLY